MAQQTSPVDTTPRRETILTVAAQLFSRRGFAATTMRDIADATGLLAGSLYHHFESKDAIADAILSRSLEGLLDRYRAAQRETTDPASQLAGLVRASFAAMADDPDAALIYLRDRELFLQIPRFAYLEATRAQVDDIWLGVLRTGQRRGAFRSDVDAQTFYRYASTALWWSAGWQRVDAAASEGAADAFLSIFRQAITALPAAKVRSKR